MFPIAVYTTKSGTDPNAPRTDGTAVSGSSTFYSSMWTGNRSDGYALSVFWTGTPTGTFTLWMTDKEHPDETNDNDWVQDTSFTPTNPAGSAGKFRDDAGNAKAYRKRLKYVNASGTGTVTAYVTVPQLMR